jgi:hypothetical protein
MVSTRLSRNTQAFAQLSINAAWGSLARSARTGTPTMLSVPGVFSEFILRTGDQTGESCTCSSIKTLSAKPKTAGMLLLLLFWLLYSSSKYSNRYDLCLDSV